MSKYTAQGSADFKLKRLTEAVKRNKDILGHIFLALSEEVPNAGLAQECFEEICPDDQIAIWSVSTAAGGIWDPWERDAIKFGCLDATPSYETHCKRHAIPYPQNLATAIERRERSRALRGKA